MTTLDELWHRWDDGGRRKADLDVLVVASRPFVERVVRAVRASSEHATEDLQSEGTIGLMAAVPAFDPARGTRFETFAQHRVRAAVIDQMRSTDPLTRRIRQRANAVTGATEALTRTLKRTPMDSEVAGYLGWDEHQVQETRLDVLASQAARWAADAEPTETTDDTFGYDQIKARVGWALDQLTGVDRAVMVLYYVEDLPMKEVAEVLGVSTSLISKIRDRAAQQVMDLLRSR